MTCFRAVNVALLALVASACPPQPFPSDAGTGAGQDAGTLEACTEVPTTCEPAANQSQLEARDRCAVCARGLCRLERGVSVCGRYEDPHPTCTDIESSLPAATDEDGKRPLIVGASIELPIENPSTCANGFLWSVDILRVPGAPSAAHVVIGDAAPMVIALNDRGPFIYDEGVPSLLSLSSASICLDLGPDDPLPEFSIQLVDDASRRSPRICGALEIELDEA